MTAQNNGLGCIGTIHDPAARALLGNHALDLYERAYAMQGEASLSQHDAKRRCTKLATRCCTASPPMANGRHPTRSAFGAINRGFGLDALMHPATRRLIPPTD